MKNKAKFIPFLLAVPLLFMANSPYPYATDEPYEDFTATFVSREKNDEEGIDNLTLNISNTGTGYLNLSSLYTEVSNQGFSLRYPTANGFAVANNWRSDGFLLPPKESLNVVYDLTHEHAPADLDFSEVTYTGQAFSEYTKMEADVEIELVNTDTSKPNETTYEFKLFGLKGFESGYNYSGITVFTVKGTKVAVHSMNWDSGSSSFYVTSYGETLTADDFVFTELYMVQGREFYGNSIAAVATFLLIFVGAAVILLPALAIVVFVILPAILIPIIVTKSVKKRRNQSPPNNDDSGPTT